MQDIANLIQTMGFPMFIALLFYLDLRKVVNRNTQAINGLTQQQEQLIELLKK